MDYPFSENNCIFYPNMDKSFRQNLQEFNENLMKSQMRERSKEGMGNKRDKGSKRGKG